MTNTVTVDKDYLAGLEWLREAVRATDAPLSVHQAEAAIPPKPVELLKLEGMTAVTSVYPPNCRAGWQGPFTGSVAYGPYCASADEAILAANAFLESIAEQVCQQKGWRVER